METFRVNPESGILSEPELAACEVAVKFSEPLVIPMDTAYGIVSVPFELAAVRRLQGVKGRGEDFPPPMLVSGVVALDPLLERLAVFGALTPSYEVARRLATVSWPGPLTITVRANSCPGWNLGKIGGATVLRQPSHPVALQILEATNPLVATLASRHGAPFATGTFAATAYFWDKVTAYADTGESSNGQSSTIVNLAELDAAGQPVIARTSTITTAEVRTVLSS